MSNFYYSRKIFYLAAAVMFFLCGCKNWTDDAWAQVDTDQKNTSALAKSSGVSIPMVSTSLMPTFII